MACSLIECKAPVYALRRLIAEVFAPAARARLTMALMHNENQPHEDDRPVHPFSALSPDCVLDALDSVGLRGDGRLLALNSYENRVYQVGIEDSAPLVAKFYRPARWSDAAILEEHAFVSELVEREIPVVPALAINGSTLHQYQGFRFAVFPRHGGRAPELDDPATLEWIGRFIGRIHAVGALSTYQERPALDHADLRRRAARVLAGRQFHAARTAGRVFQRGAAGARRRQALL